METVSVSCHTRSTPSPAASRTRSCTATTVRIAKFRRGCATNVRRALADPGVWVIAPHDRGGRSQPGYELSGAWSSKPLVRLVLLGVPMSTRLVHVLAAFLLVGALGVEARADSKGDWSEFIEKPGDRPLVVTRSAPVAQSAAPRAKPANAVKPTRVVKPVKRRAAKSKHR